MSPPPRTGFARRLLSIATAAMPSSRREWGRAISAELACARTRGEQARLVLAAARIAMLPPPWVADYLRVVGRSAAVAAIAYVPVGLALYLSNVVFPSPQDSTAGVLALYAYLLVALMAAGAFARGAAPGPGAVIAGITAGLVLAVLGLATFAVIDNAFLSIVSHQQGKIDGFQASGMASMRAYINADLEAMTPGVVILMTIAGAIFAPVGAALNGFVKKLDDIRRVYLAWRP
jgi:hypothetical protein